MAVNGYKRTIREQIKTIEKRDKELEAVKRGMKVTQVNELAVEGGSYRDECLRLREQLEDQHTLMLQRESVLSQQIIEGRGTVSAASGTKRDPFEDNLMQKSVEQLQSKN